MGQYSKLKKVVRTGVDVEIVDDNGIMLSTVEFHGRKFVVIDREGHERAAGDLYEAEPGFQSGQIQC